MSDQHRLSLPEDDSHDAIGVRHASEWLCLHRLRGHFSHHWMACELEPKLRLFLVMDDSGRFYRGCIIVVLYDPEKLGEQGQRPLLSGANINYVF